MGKFRGIGGNFLTWIGIVSVLLILYNVLADVSSNAKRISFSDFLDQVESDIIKEVVIRGNIIEGKDVKGRPFNTVTPQFYPKLIETMHSHQVRMNIQPLDTPLTSLMGIIISWLPVFLLAGVWMYFMKSMQGGSKAMGFGKSRARAIPPGQNKIRFVDVAGVDEAKDELHEVVQFLQNPPKFQEVGGKMPKGLLLVGPPGTGKTLLARAVAGEAGVPFFSMAGSEFVEMFVGVGASRVRDLFEQAKKTKEPCIIFMDEIDAVGRSRGAGLGGGNDEREQTLNQLLVEMDGFTENETIIILAATNRPDVLDPALLRPGRFDRQVHVPLPDVEGRQAILQVHLKNKNIPIAKDVSIKTAARSTPGFSGADLASLLNEAAISAARLGKKHVTMKMLEDARDKLVMGRERRSMVMSDKEKRLTAYHEGGHAIIAIYVPGSDPLHKVTIIPRGHALGVTMRLPEGDRYSVTREKLYADVAVAMGGRVAEELIFGHSEVTTGASSDIKMANKIARQMVTEWGLSDTVGLIHISADDYEGFGRKGCSEELAKKIDAEVSEIINQGYKTAIAILSEHIEGLHKLAAALLERETLSAEEVRKIINPGEDVAVET